MHQLFADAFSTIASYDPCAFFLKVLHVASPTVKPITQERVWSVSQAADCQRAAYDAVRLLQKDMLQAKSSALRLKLSSEIRAQIGAWVEANAAVRMLKPPSQRPKGEANGNGHATPKTPSRARKGISLMADPSPPTTPAPPLSNTEPSRQEAPQESHAVSGKGSEKATAEVPVVVKDPVDGFGDPKVI